MCAKLPPSINRVGFDRHLYYEIAMGYLNSISSSMHENMKNRAKYVPQIKGAKAFHLHFSSFSTD